MPDYAALKAEIALPAYAGKSDPEIAALLEAPLILPVDVPVGTVEGYFRSRMLLTRLQRFVAAPPDEVIGIGVPGDLVDGLAEFLGMIASPHVQSVQMTDPTVNAAVTATINAAATAGLMTAQQAADLLALGATQTTRATQLGLDTQHDISNEILAARIWPGVAPPPEATP